MRRRGTIARTLAFLFACGALLLICTLLMAGPPDRNELALAAIATVALAFAAGLLISFGRTPMWALTLAPGAGSLLVGAVICFAGTQAASAYALFFIWTVIAAATFLSREGTALHGVFAFVVYDIAIHIAGPDSLPSDLSLAMLVGTATVVSVVLAGLAVQTRAFVAELENDAHTDPLTELGNRRAMREDFNRELARSDRSGRPVSLISLDLDHFKEFNDALGHPAGDNALRRLARIMEDVTRAGEVCARTGGEEFAILAPDTDADGAIALAERVRIAVEREFAGSRQPLTVSCGIAVHRPGGLGPQDLVAAADRALYAAKDKGRNRVEVAGGRRFVAGAVPQLAELSSRASATK